MRRGPESQGRALHRRHRCDLLRFPAVHGLQAPRLSEASPAPPAAQLCGVRPCQRLAAHGQPRRRVGSRLPAPAAPPAWSQGLPAPPPAAHVSAARSRPHAAVSTLRLAGGGAAGGAAAAVAAAAAAPAGTCTTIGRRRLRAACLWQAQRRQTSRPTTPQAATTSPCASPPRGAVPAKSATQPVRRRHACVTLRCRCAAAVGMPGRVDAREQSSVCFG